MNPEQREFLVHPDMVGRLRRREGAMIAACCVSVEPLSGMSPEPPKPVIC